MMTMTLYVCHLDIHIDNLFLDGMIQMIHFQSVEVTLTPLVELEEVWCLIRSIRVVEEGDQILVLVFLVDYQEEPFHLVLDLIPLVHLELVQDLILITCHHQDMMTCLCERDLLKTRHFIGCIHVKFLIKVIVDYSI